MSPKKERGNQLNDYSCNLVPFVVVINVVLWKPLEAAKLDKYKGTISKEDLQIVKSTTYIVLES